MRHDKLEKELDLLLMLTENHNYTVSDICERQGLSRRNFYYYLEFFRRAGFIVDHNKPFYRLRKDSPFFRKLDESVHFTEDEAIALRQVIDLTADQSLQMQRIRQKLNRLYDLEILDSVELKQQLAHNVRTLYEAIKQRRCVVLKGYSSPHSNTVQDRVVEPFLFMNGNREIRCYEVSSAMNKTFKLTRMQDVELIDLLWSHEEAHRHVHTDIFMFSGERLLPVSLRMGRLSASVMREEYPQAERYLAPVAGDESHWTLTIDVCSYSGIGRFVLGLFDDIEVLGGEGFSSYIREKVAQMGRHIQKTPYTT